MSAGRKLQVFVSSTYTDLKEERQTAVSAILKAGHIPAGMELFSAGDQSQLQVIKKWIDQSDVYMLILGTRYGSIEPISKDGYTEVEFDYAVSTGKPFFSLVMGDPAIDSKLKQTGREFLEDKHPEKLKSFRDKVLARMCAIYNDPRDIKSYIYESLIDFANRPDLEGWVRGSAIVDPQPLYKQISELTDEVKQLKSELSDARLNQDEAVPIPLAGEDFSTLKRILSAQVVIIPPEISSTGEEITRNAFGLFKANLANCIRGLTVNSTSKPQTKWFEENVYSAFVTHRLIEVNRSPVQRTYHITDRGIDFAAWIDRDRYALKEEAS